MDAAHSILPPSSANIWGSPHGCTGWVKMAQENPEPDEPSESSAEGTGSHEVGEQLIRHTLRLPDRPAEPLGVDGIASNGVVVTEEMYEGAELYADDVTGTYYDLVHSGNSVKMSVEDKLPITAVHAQCFGTTDSWVWALQARELYIWDYKFGHRFVEVFETGQGICYAAGLLRKLNLEREFDVTIVFRIVQPRSFHRDGPIREWRITVKEILFYIGLLTVKAAESLDFENCEVHTGPHCRDCQARHACEPALAAGLGFYEMAARPVSHQMSFAAMGFQLDIIERALDQLKSLKTGFEARIESTIKGGKLVPGYGVIPTVGRETWMKPISEVIELGEMFGLDLSKPGAITPNQARKLGVSNELITAYAGKPSRGLKLVRLTETSIKKAFYTGG